MSKPDWLFWRAMPGVTVWQATALSLDIDPDSMKYIEGAWMADGPIFTGDSFPNNEVKGQFDKRLRLLEAHCTNRECFSHVVISPRDAGFNKVKPSEFAAWAKSRGWKIPPKLTDLANVTTAPAEAKAQSGVVWTPEKRKQLRDEHRTLTASGKKSPTEMLAKKYEISTTRIRELKREKQKPEVGSKSNWGIPSQSKKSR